MEKINQVILTLLKVSIFKEEDASELAMSTLMKRMQFQKTLQDFGTIRHTGRLVRCPRRVKVLIYFQDGTWFSI
jgi:hypothetical protein